MSPVAFVAISLTFVSPLAPRPTSLAPPSFLNDVLPLLTRIGCNQGACHGKAAGQNGFRLSLRGYAPEWDYEWLTREYEGRRINRAYPDASLILLKPGGKAPHQGGKLFDQNSRAYKLLRAWIAAGAPGPTKSDPSLRRITLLPGDRILKPGSEVQLQLQAEFSDGQTKDVTWLAQFVSYDPGVAEVTPDGRAKVVRPGATAIRAMFLGEVAVVVLTAPYEQPVAADLFKARNNFIDDHVFQKLAALRIEPSGPCSDEVFLRRVYIDAMGILPTPTEVRSFLADGDPAKRAKVIDKILERPEFVDYWTLLLDDLVQNRKESDHDVRGVKGVQGLHQWLRDQVARNRPWDEVARALLTATGTTKDCPPVGYYIVEVGENREADRSTIVAAAAQTFLGVRIGCAKCHNHPLEKYTQDDYYHFAGFFSRIKFDRKEPKKGATKLIVSAPDANQSKNPVGVVQPRTGKFLAPQTLDRTTPKIKPGDDPRQALAAWITDPRNEYFAGAMVNRLWAHFFGVGLVEPIDDLRASNPPTNPELWHALTKEFAQHKFDRKHMIRLILNSRAYQLSSATKPANERDRRFYSHYQARRLPAEVMLDAISQATGVPDKFDGYPVGTHATQVPDPAVKSYFLGLFGRSERLTACACERNSEVTLPQLLHMNGGATIGHKLHAPEGRLNTWLKSNMTDAEMIDTIFITCLARHPREEERALIEASLKSAGAAGRADAFRDVFWAILNTKELAFNH